MMLAILVVSICALLVINTAATVAVRRDDSLESSQAAFQIALIWLVPVLGALLSFFFRHIQAADPVPSSPGSTGRGEFAHELDLYQANQLSETPPNDTP